MISIIIPMYNGEKYIQRCIESINNSFNKDIEIVIVDDGSTDNSLKICKEIANKCNNIYIYSQKNMGVSSARNFGISKANGEWITFVDADDIIIKSFGEETLNCNIDWIIYSKYFEEDKIVCNEFEKNQLKLAINNLKSQYNKMHLNTVWSKLYRRAIINRNNIKFNDKLIHGEDMIFNLKYFECCKNIILKKKSVYCLCSNEESATRKFQKNIIKNDDIFLNEVNKLVDEKNYNIIVLNSLWICLNQYFFHIDNTKNKKEKILELKEFVNLELYKKILKNLNKIEYPLSRKCIFVLIKTHCYYIIFILFKLKQKNKVRSKKIDIEI